MLRSKGSRACLFPPSFTPVSLSYPLFSPSRLQCYSFPIAATSGANMPCHSLYCLCGTAQVPAGLCAARCPGQGPDTRLRSVCCCGLAHKTPLRVLPCCQRFPKRKQLSYQIRKAVFGYVSWRNAAGVLHMQSVILISITCRLLCSDPLEFVTASRRVQKLAVGKALSSAFQKILLVVLGKAYFFIKRWGVWANDIITCMIIDVNSVSLNLSWDSLKLGGSQAKLNLHCVL